MNIYSVIISILILTAFLTNVEKDMQKDSSYSFYVGTYTNSESQGIYKFLLNGNGTIDQIGLSAKSENPSFLTMSFDKKYLVAVNETNINGLGTVESYLIEKDSLIFISRSSSGGAHPCFVTMNDEGFLLTANYTSGNIGLLKLNSTGELSDILDLQQHSGSDITRRQKGPHAHSVWIEPQSQP